jgi:serine/threonine protein kinase
MKICSSCGKQFDDQMVFCPMCGRGLTGMLRPPQETKTDPHLGAVIDGKYRLDQKIGTGGMGIVYKATHLHMHSTVAVKLLNTTLVSDEHAVERFRREAQAAARIQHPNAVSVTDFGVTPGGEVYIVMEYLEGSDLRERLKSQKRVGAEEAIRIMVQVLGAVHKAHARGVIHRDLKPDNVWITQEEDTGEERVKVLDFGIAKLKNQTGGAALTQHGMMVGTPHYMSPEQVNGAELDARSDVYAAGIMLYEMLCGTRPFEAGTPFAVAMMHLTQKPQSLSEVNPEVPAQLAAAVMRAIEKEPADRPATAAEFAASLLDALRASTGQSVSLPSGAFASPDTSLSPDRSFPPERARLATPQTPHPTTPTPPARRARRLDEDDPRRDRRHRRPGGTRARCRRDRGRRQLDEEAGHDVRPAAARRAIQRASHRGRPAARRHGPHPRRNVRDGHGRHDGSRRRPPRVLADRSRFLPRLERGHERRVPAVRRRGRTPRPERLARRKDAGRRRAPSRDRSHLGRGVRLRGLERQTAADRS